MTGAASIQSSSSAPPSGVNAKERVVLREEGDPPELDEMSAFAEFFSFFESEESALDSETAPAEEDIGADGNKKDDEEVTALQIEMTHHAWFGGDNKIAAPEETFQRPPSVILKAEPESPDVEANTPLNPMPPLAMSDWPDTAERENGDLLYRLVHQDLPSGRGDPQAQRNNRTAPIHPLEIAETLANVELQPKEKPALSMPVEPPVPAPAPEVQTPRIRTPEVRSSKADPVADESTANIKASLSALEAVLARDPTDRFQDSPPRDDRMELAREAIKEAGISSVRQETHYSFGLSQSPVLQIAQRLTHEIHIERSQVIDRPDPAAMSQKAPVRVLHIQLDPPQLGPLTIRISLQNDLLNLQLETPNPETAKLIHNDKESLSKLLRSAGYIMDGLSIQVAPAERGSGGQASALGGGFGQATGQQPGWRQPDGRTADGGWRTQNHPEVSSSPGTEPSAPQTGRPRNGGVYL